MKVGIYSELYAGAGLGGREYIVAILCEALARQGHTVEYVHHLDQLTAEEFSARFGIPPETVQLKHVGTRPRATARGFLASQRARQEWNRGLSRDYDLFINIVHEGPERCFAKAGVLMVLFPFFEPFRIWSGRNVHGAGRSDLWVFARYLYHRARWRSLMDSYSLKTSISEYARAWTQRRWGVDSTVIYPPCDSSFRPGEKRNRIVSVGRFAGDRAGGVSKRQLEMMRAFLELYGNGFSGWEYHTLGGVGAWPQDIAYAQQVREIAQTNADAYVVANAPRATLSELYASSKIFWHAAGFRDDDQQHPELMEHFGIATVDAMSAGCVPVVINKGAQPEIVEHGVSGFLWNTVDELKNYTRILAQDGELREQMANAAMRQAERFSRENFVRRFAEFVQPVLNVPVT